MKRCLLILAMLFAQVTVAYAAAPPPPRDLLNRVGIQQQLGAQLPMDAVFTDANGQTAPLSHWIDDRPVVLMPGYFSCPNLCDTTLQAMAYSLDLAGLQPGKDVSVIFLSIDPSESAADATKKQQKLALMKGNNGVGAWHFLVGSEASIQAVTHAAGYRYVYDAKLKQYAHPAGAIVARGDGRINQYLLGVSYAPQTLRQDVAAASRHTLGSLVDQLVLLCCGYDPTTGRHTITVVRVMQWLGVGFLSLLVLVFAVLRRPGRKAPT
ncbi:SCO family protein [Dyella acidiphila]|uniref:SCO family protein n=1 Tax=Dyella acidiphila TaxID=2775866 RepID=A0ABR9GC03_9GAMM|nr:SCO family protein [Dyella acidiphila]MBE1161539.1 SCO family protein [Dyella acidiphila]